MCNQKTVFNGRVGTAVNGGTTFTGPARIGIPDSRLKSDARADSWETTTRCRPKQFHSALNYRWERRSPRCLKEIDAPVRCPHRGLCSPAVLREKDFVVGWENRRDTIRSFKDGGKLVSSIDRDRSEQRATDVVSIFWFSIQWICGKWIRKWKHVFSSVFSEFLV